MEAQELEEHDEAWGLDFGDYNQVALVYGQQQHPENLVEHPMSINIKDSFVKFLKEYPAQITSQDGDGYTLLHREVIAGNRSSAEVLLQFAADKNIKTATGKSALDYARQLGWQHIVPLLENSYPVCWF